MESETSHTEVYYLREEQIKFHSAAGSVISKRVSSVALEEGKSADRLARWRLVGLGGERIGGNGTLRFWDFQLKVVAKGSYSKQPAALE